MYDDKVFGGGGGSGSSDIVEISNTEISEGDTIDTSIYYYQPSSSPSGEDTKNEKLFLQNSLGKAVEVGFLSKDTQTISLSRNGAMLSAEESVTIAVTCEGEIIAKTLDSDAATVVVDGSNVIITAHWSSNVAFTKIIVTARSTQTKMSTTAIINIVKNNINYGTAPEFNSNNFITLDTTATIKYYFGQYGNAFYGVYNGMTTSPYGGRYYKSGTYYDRGYAGGEPPYWELVDTDASINGVELKTIFGVVGYSGYRCDASSYILGNSNNVKNIYFCAADHTAMKNSKYAILVTDDSNAEISDKNSYSTPVNGSIQPNNAYMWSLSYTQLNANRVLGGAIYAAANAQVWTRTLANDASVGNYAQAHFISNSSGVIATYNDVSYDVENAKKRFAPAFNLNLSKVLLLKAALYGSTFQDSVDVSVKVAEDTKFLINCDTVKSDFTVDALGNYSVTEITSLNSGTNYISFIIYDEDGISIFYGNIEELTTTSGQTDLSAVTSVLENADPGVYTLAVFQEEKCDAYKTDYASTPCYFSFTVG